MIASAEIHSGSSSSRVSARNTASVSGAGTSPPRISATSRVRVAVESLPPLHATAQCRVDGPQACNIGRASVRDTECPHVYMLSGRLLLNKKQENNEQQIK